MRAIVVLMDTLRRDHLSAYHPQTPVKTDNIAAFARDSIVFDNHFVGSMPCMPARRDLFTGRLNFLERSWGPIEIFDKTLPAELRKNKIASHMITDHAHYFRIGGENYCQQFDTYEFFRGQESDPWISMVDDPVMPETWFGEVKRQYQCNRTMFKTEADYPSVKCFSSACDWLERNKNADDFLLMVETFDPHEPFDIPQEYLDLYQDDYQGPHFDLPKYHARDEETDEAMAHIHNRYSALITMTDNHFGKLIDKLKALDMYDDTLIILTTDHGYCFGEREFIGKSYMHSFNELANIPLIVHLPQHRLAGTRYQALTQNIDIMPTLLSHFGIETPPEVSGKSLFNIIDNNQCNHPYVIYGTHGATVNICDGRYTYFRAPRDNSQCYEYTTSLTTIRDWLGKTIPEKIEVGHFLPRQPFPVYKVPAVFNPIVQDQRYLQHDALFDIQQDYEQLENITDPVLTEQMVTLLKTALQQHDAPPEQRLRLGLY
ncbi:TPA: sulfatase [Salmonella enterica]|nr:sulfatase [Salmonella enterica]